MNSGATRSPSSRGRRSRPTRSTGPGSGFQQRRSGSSSAGRGPRARRPFGDSQALLDRYARTWLNSEGLSGPAGRFLPNEFGLFDTLGSLWEWCQDGPPGSYGATDDGLYPLYPTAVDDRPAPDRVCAMPASQSDWRILRGGVFDRSPSMARSSHRDVMRASAASYTAGFRVVRTIPHGGNRR